MTKHFTLTLRAAPGRDGVRDLRALLKIAWRHLGLRAVTVTAKEFGAQRSDRFGIHEEQEIQMDKLELEKLKHYAATTKSSIAFGGAQFIKWEYKTGKFLVGKNNANVTGKKFVADLPDIMVEAKKKPEYAVVKILGDVAPIERDELGENDKSMWLDDKDPWTPVTVLPLFDPETRQVFVFPATYSARGAVANLLEAFADHSATHPETTDQLPIVQLCVREYTKGDGNPGYAVAFDIDGWIDRPNAVLHIQAPPLTVTVEASKADHGKSATADSSKAKSSDDKAKPKRKITLPGKTDMDDIIPF
jgi:hypothetical protein